VCRLSGSSGLSRLFGLFGLSRLFGFSGSSNKTNQIDQTNQVDQMNQTNQNNQPVLAFHASRSIAAVPLEQEQRVIQSVGMLIEARP
jgi:hypothetical protein